MGNATVESTMKGYVRLERRVDVDGACQKGEDAERESNDKTEKIKA